MISWKVWIYILKTKGGKNSVVNDHEVCVALVNIRFFLLAGRHRWIASIVTSLCPLCLFLSDVFSKDTLPCMQDCEFSFPFYLFSSLALCCVTVVLLRFKLTVFIRGIRDWLYNSFPMNLWVVTHILLCSSWWFFVLKCVQVNDEFLYFSCNDLIANCHKGTLLWPI